jgi:hypothetical protein
MPPATKWVLTVTVTAVVWCVGGLVACSEAGGVFDHSSGSDGDDDKEVEAVCAEPPCLPAPPDCGPLLARTCSGCATSTACIAATLLANHEPEQCAAAFTDERTFPSCTESACVALMERVCGGVPAQPACVDNPGCGPAQALWERSTVGDATTDEIVAAEASCADALTDEAVFAACTP